MLCCSVNQMTLGAGFPRRILHFYDSGENTMSTEMPVISEDLLAILACPKCHGEVKLVNNEKLVCQKCGAEYRIENGIPIMLVDEE